MEGDHHDLSLQIFRIIQSQIHNCSCEVSGSYMLQLASAAAISIPASSVPSSSPILAPQFPASPARRDDGRWR